jgi:hypothetical protein
MMRMREGNNKKGLLWAGAKKKKREHFRRDDGGKIRFTTSSFATVSSNCKTVNLILFGGQDENRSP